MKVKEAMVLNQILSDPGIKTNFAKGSVYVDLLAFKRPIKAELQKVEKEEQDLLKEFEIVPDENGKFNYADKPYFKEKFEAIRENEMEVPPKKLNFLEIEDFMRIFGHLPMDSADYIAKFLLKDEPS